MTRTAVSILILMLLAVALPIGCGSTGGKSYTETSSLQILENASEIDGKHEIFGELRIEGTRGCSIDFLKRQAAREGMERGADAVLIGEMKDEDVKTEDGRKRLSYVIAKLIKYK